MILEYQDILQKFGIETKKQHDEWMMRTFRYVAKLAFGEEEEYMWWNDSFGIEFDVDSAIAFMSDFVDHYPNAVLSITVVLDSVCVKLSIDNEHYVVKDYIDNDAHLNIFGMVIWAIAKSFRYKEELE